MTYLFTNNKKVYLNVLAILGFIIIVAVIGVYFKRQENLTARFYNQSHAQAKTIKDLTSEPTNEKEAIIFYIRKVFGKYSDSALKIAQCESHLNPMARNDNTQWGGVGVDRGIFQLNNVYQKIDNPNFLYDYKTNINMAWVIFKNSNYNWHLWTCKI